MKTISEPNRAPVADSSLIPKNHEGSRPDIGMSGFKGIRAIKIHRQSKENAKNRFVNGKKFVSLEIIAYLFILQLALRGLELALIRNRTMGS